jgi:hypothetical protein
MLSRRTSRRPATSRLQLTALQDRFTDHVRAITSGAAWAAWLAAAAKFHSYRTVLIQMQATDATRVGGYNTWKAVGRQVSKGEKGIAILAPVVRKVDVDAGLRTRPHRPRSDAGSWPPPRRTFSTSPKPRRSLCPSRHNPRSYRAKRRGLWDQLANQVRDAGYELEPGRPSPRRWPVRAMSAPCSYACV